MKWTEIKVTTTGEASEAVSEMLTTVGAGGVAIEDPDDIRKEIERVGSLDYADDDFLNSLGEDVIIKAYFNEETNKNELIQLVKEKINFISRFLSVGKGEVEFTEIDEQDWATGWKKYYKPFNISSGVVIKPTWEIYNSVGNEKVIEMDPGMAFGTGTHETTRMCSEFLEECLKEGDTVIDVGCGTGILSIISAKLGAKHITAVDIDEVAVKVTNENCRKNNVEQCINAFKGELTDIKHQKADIIVANIIANIIIDISKDIHYYLKAEGLFIASGIIKERKQEVLDTYQGLGFECVKVRELGEWVAILFRCQDSL